MADVDAYPKISHANRNDVPVILALIRELAAYDKEPDKVLATENSLVHTLTFARGPPAPTNPGYARTFLIRLPANDLDEPSRVAGMALYFNNYSTWRAKPGIYLEDLYVRPEYRGRGYEKMLLRTLAKEVLIIRGGRLEWNCLRWNEPSLKFYKELGATEMQDWVGLRVDGQALVDLADGKSKGLQRSEEEEACVVDRYLDA